MALPEISRPLLKFFGTLFPGKVLRDLEAARATMFETSLALTRAARARVEGGGVVASSADSSSSSSKKKNAPRGVAKGAFPELFITASRGEGSESSGGEGALTGASQPYDDVTIASQCQTFLLAGYETTATTLAFCVHWLAAHPEAAAKLARELDDAARAEKEGGEGGVETHGDDDGEAAATASTSVAGISASRVARLPYLDAVLKEVLRLTPAAPITLRVAAQDQAVSFLAAAAATNKKCDDGDGNGEATKKSSSLVIPKGTWIHVDSFHISRDPLVWGPDALQFRPERWLEKSSTSSSSSSAALQTWAFGDGSLACVGRRLAEWESKLTLAALFRRFEFALEQGSKGGQALELECRLTLGPKAGVTVMATARIGLEEEEKKTKAPALAKRTSSGRLFGSRKAVSAAA